MIATLFGAFLGLLFLGVPVAASIGLALLLLSVTTGDYSFVFLTRAAVASMDSFPILAVPMFILAGEIMGKGDISRRLFNFANACVGHLTGGMAMATVLTCMLFGAISGSGPATFAAVGTIMIPMMVKQGYDKAFVTGMTVASGGLGVLIPPSLPMVIYGITAGVSIGDMFIAGLLPGIVSGLAIMIYCWFYCRRYPLQRTSEAEPRMSLFASIKEGFWALFSPVIVLGGIYSGLFTPTEAAAAMVVYGIFVGRYIYNALTYRDLLNLLLRTASVCSPVLLVVAMATVLGRVLSLEKIPTALAGMVLNVSNNPIVILLIINLLLLVAGMLMETLASIIILTPMLLPIAAAIGISPVHFGTIMVANLAIGFATPPIGVSLYIAASITGLPFASIAKASVGAILALLIALFLITAIPAISTWLPALILH
jgi:C4-dicarboxylate transporter DctM subunit